MVPVTVPVVRIVIVKPTARVAVIRELVERGLTRVVAYCYSITATVISVVRTVTMVIGISGVILIVITVMMVTMIRLFTTMVVVIIATMIRLLTRPTQQE